jgi:hypothetical protein
MGVNFARNAIHHEIAGDFSHQPSKRRSDHLEEPLASRSFLPHFVGDLPGMGKVIVEDDGLPNGKIVIQQIEVGLIIEPE